MWLLSTTQLSQTLKHTMKMKKRSVIVFFISLLLAAAICATNGELVKDSDGNPVQVARPYFIQPVKTENNSGGGLVPAPNTIFPLCPLGISQIPIADQPGLPVSVTYPFILPALIVTSSIVNIEFKSNIWPVCNEFSKYWEVDDSSNASKEPAILIGGNPTSPNSWFKIEKAGEESGENTYKLTTLNGTVGAIQGACFRAPQLVLTNDDAKILLVKFKKVNDDTTAIPSTSTVDSLRQRMFPFY